jgi:hypothetical protein
MKFALRPPVEASRRSRLTGQLLPTFYAAMNDVSKEREQTELGAVTPQPGAGRRPPSIMHDERWFVFLHIPKTGGSSLISLLRLLFPEEQTLPHVTKTVEMGPWAARGAPTAAKL